VTVLYLLPRQPRASETFVLNEIRAVRRQVPQPADAVALVLLGGLPQEPGFVPATGFSVRSFARALVRLRGNPTYRLRNALLVGRAVPSASRLAPDVVHCHFLGTPYQVGNEVARQLGVRMTVTSHAADYRGARARRLDAAVLRTGQLVLISDAARADLLALGYPEDVVRAAPVVRAALHPELAHPARARLSSSDRHRLVTVARLVEKKGIDLAIKAVAELVHRGLPIHYRIVGDGPQAGALQELARDLGISDRVEFLGSRTHRDALAVLDDSDCAVLPCVRSADGDEDGIPVFLMEAAARGVPVVTTRLSGIPELFDDESAYFCAPTPADVAEVVATAVTDPLAEQRAAAAARRLADEFDPDLQARRLLGLWEHRLASRP
jgi:colanic acid/amylovoran biosynthesis glycosyltransferase